MGAPVIEGVIPPTVTPFTASGEVDVDAHVANIRRWNETGLRGYLVLGSNSEAAFLDESEKLALIRVTRQAAPDGRLIMAGTGRESTRGTIALTNAAAEAGADCALVLTPSYYQSEMGDATQIAFFTEVAEASDIPILVYNVTKFTGINVSPHAVGVLAQHPNIIGMKDSSGDVPQLVRLIRAIGSSAFTLMVGTASAWFPALTLGVRAAVMALANCCPNELVAVQTLFDAGDVAGARELYERLSPLNDAVTARFGVAGLKYACDRLGFRGGEVRRPLLPITDDRRRAIDEALVGAGLVPTEGSVGR